MKRFFAILLVVISGCKPAPSPSADLASPSQEVRDAAAKMLRANAKPPSKSKWFLLTARIRAGKSKADVEKLLRPYNVIIMHGARINSVAPYYEDYQLDDYWILECRYQDDDSLMERKLVSGWREVAVWPSTNFSGVWINYYANGQKFTEGYWTNGNHDSEFTTFNRDGSKSAVYQYDHGVEKSLTSFFPSGRISIQGQYSNHLPIGIWIHYNEDGSTNYISDRHYDNGVHQSLMTKYFPSGHVQFADQVSNNVVIRIVFNEDGSTNEISYH